MTQHVLIVEDDVDIAHLIEIRLTRKGYETRCATNGAEAVALLDEFRPGVIVTDWNMPVLTGIEMCALIRRDQVHPQPRIIMITAQVGAASEQQARTAGVDDYLEKPISFPLLMERVSTAFAA